ncbi:hypothetical protein [Labilibacter marinus]|uniref:hypothetical protein n=1 Tax=Labilibacter marinus TaxID=1477105 RepID=UPI00082E8F60|nr:hypothetical protein [Labilibacter marinus]
MKSLIIRYLLLSLVLLLAVIPVQVKAQVMDTIAVEANSFFVTKDTVLYFERDTVVILETSKKYKISENKTQKTSQFYGNIYNKSQNNWITSELYEFIFRSPEKKDTTQADKILENSQDPFRKYEGKVIGDIHISNLDFLYSIELEDSIKKNSLLNKSIADVHVTTKKRIIKKNLTFHSEEKVNPFVLAENERILRQLAALEDARITLVERHGNTDTVDVIVTTIDVFPVGIDGSFNGFRDFKLGVYNKNFLGTGTEWKNTIVHKKEYDPSWGYIGNYKYKNIQGSFVDFDLTLKLTDPSSEFKGRFERDLTIPTVNTGGTVELGYKSYTANVGPEDVQIDTVISSIFQDYWVGHKVFKNNKSNKNIILKARYFNERFDDRPFVSPDSNYVFHRKQQYFGSLLYYNVQYLKSRYLLGFGITEDVPYGFILQGTLGYEKSEFFEYPYMRFDIGYAKYLRQLGYFQIISNYGTYLDKGEMVNSVFRTRIKTFSNLFYLGRYKLREFFNISYVHGSDMFEYNKLTMSKPIQGLKHKSIGGESRLVFGSETVLFTPWYFYGFRMATVLKLDAGFIGSDRNFFQRKNFNAGIGTGFNIRNESLAFSTISIRASYYPGNSNYNGFWGFNFTLSDPKLFKDLSIGKPKVIEYD